MIGDDVIQTVPILTPEDVEPLKKVQFGVTHRTPSTVPMRARDLYTATDDQFVRWLSWATKARKETLLSGEALGDGWNNSNRLRTRLRLVKRFRKSIARVQKTVDKQ